MRAGQLLLCKRSPQRDFFPNVWDVVGGHCLGDEKPEAALVREMEEELGIRPTSYARLAVLHEVDEAEGPTAEYHVFLVTEWEGGEPACLGEEHTEVRWFTPERALALDLVHPGYRQLLREFTPRARPWQSEDDV